jgi:NADH-quinone oxidoreductase subunit C
VALSLGEVSIKVSAANYLSVMQTLRDAPACKFEQLMDLCGVDYPERPERFDVVYHLLSPRFNRRIRVKLRTNEDHPVPSAVGVFSSAGWFEREAWDLYGVRFEGHPNHTRIMMWEGFEGHPLRKDYPINKRQPLTTLLGEQK